MCELNIDYNVVSGLLFVIYGQPIETTMSTEPVHFVRHIIDALRDNQINTEPLQQRFNLSDAFLGNNDNAISSELYSQLLDEVLNQNSHLCIGLYEGEHINLLDHGVLGYAMFASANLEKLLRRHEKYQEIIGAIFKTRLVVEQEVSRVETTSILRPELANTELKRRFHIESLFAQWKQLGTIFGGKKNWFNHMSLPIHEDRIGETYRAYFNCPISFDATCASFSFDSSLLEHPLTFANESAAKMCEEQCKNLLVMVENNTGLNERIKRLLINNPGQFFSIQETARQLAMSERTLRRRLSVEKTSYKEIILDFKMTLAKNLLMDNRLNLGDIAELCGYSDQGNFSRAFSKFYGTQPSQFKKLAR